MNAISPPSTGSTVRSDAASNRAAFIWKMMVDMHVAQKKYTVGSREMIHDKSSGTSETEPFVSHPLSFAGTPSTYIQGAARLW